MARRGKAVLGDKTILDSVEAVRKAIENLSDPAQMAVGAEKAAGEALDAFRDRFARQGRARIFGEKSVGVDDPGMRAFYDMVQGLLP